MSKIMLVDEFELICAACGKPIEGDDLDDRHWGHEKNCPNHGGKDSIDKVEYWCDCDLDYHAECCPDCIGD